MKYKDTMSLQMLNSLCLLSMFVVGRSEDAKKFLDELGISSREDVLRGPKIYSWGCRITSILLGIIRKATTLREGTPSE